MTSSKRYIIVAAAVVTIVLAVCLIFYRVSTKELRTPSVQSAKTTITPEATGNQAGMTGVYPQISLKDQSKEEAVRIWLDRLQKDQNADWKVPIEFYGKVVDQESKGIRSAKVHFRWTNLSTHGTGQSEAVSDEQGLFHLSGVEGKRLSVQVEKEGYYGSEFAGFKSFEFSNPGEEIYYEPNKNDPVVFRLRRRGKGAELTKKSIKVFLPDAGSSATVDLLTGNVAPKGQLAVRTWKPWPPKPVSPHYGWKVELTLAGGGFADAPEEFAFEAPETTYSPSFAIDMAANRGNSWNVSAEKTLYFMFGEPQRYGRLTLRTAGNSRYVFIDYVLNPSGSRNLEETSGNQRRQ
jgi:hypothetical protein